MTRDLCIFYHIVPKNKDIPFNNPSTIIKFREFNAVTNDCLLYIHFMFHFNQLS